MPNKKITGDDIFKMCPGLKEAMNTALEQSGLFYSNFSEAIDTSARKDLIKNNTPPKKETGKTRSRKIT